MDPSRLRCGGGAVDRLAPAAGAALPMAVPAALDTAAADEGTGTAGGQSAPARPLGGRGAGGEFGELGGWDRWGGWDSHG